MTIVIPRLPSYEQPISVLAVSPSTGDRTALRSIFSTSNCTLDCVSSVREALSWMQRRAAPVIICERELPDGNWQILMRQTEAGLRPPRFIVSSRLADDRLWAEVLNLGGHDVLCTPFEACEVLYAVRMAWESWHRQWGTCLKLVGRRVAAAGSDLPPAA